MPVEFRGSTAFFARAPKEDRILGKERKGYRGGSLLAALAGTQAISVEGYEVERDARLVEGLKILGADKLTARDEALYQLMLAVAREQCVDSPFHRVDVGRVWEFLQSREEKETIDRRLDRLQDSLVRLTQTVVKYTHRDQYGKTYGAMSMVSAAIHEDLQSGTAVLDYTLPDAVKYAVLTSFEYSWMELAAFAGFDSRYAPRLYQHLARRAGMTGGLGKEWKVSPLELAKLLNYSVEKGHLHYASFRRRCLEPAIRDIAREVKNFAVSLTETKGAGRGRPVVELVFVITDVAKPFHSYQAADVPAHLAPLAAAGRHPVESLPSRLFLGRAVTLTGHTAERLHRGWQDALDAAKADPQGEIVPGLRGYEILQLVSWQDADRAFERWATAVNSHGSISSAATRPPAVRTSAPAPVEDRLQVLTSKKALVAFTAAFGPLIRFHLDSVRDVAQAHAHVDATLAHLAAEVPFFLEADALLDGRLTAACRYAADNRLPHKRWLGWIMHLRASDPARAIEDLDALLAGLPAPVPPVAPQPEAAAPAPAPAVVHEPTPDPEPAVIEHDPLDDLDDRDLPPLFAEVTSETMEDDLIPF
jgi:hypothetical protein